MGLSIENLQVVLSRRHVLRGVTTSFKPGRVIAVLGANGAGKSTLLRACAALLPVSGGHVLLDGRNVAALPPRERARAIGYLPQDAAVHWNMLVRELVQLGRLPHGDIDPQTIEAALTATDTALLADRPVRSLSGGERARVLLARVLAGEPAWLLADEPLASLDPLHQLETLKMLRATAGRGVGVVLVLHDLTLAARVADDVLLLKDGAELANGPAGEVLTAANIAAAYGVDVTILAQPDGPVIVPQGPA
ncbi:ABC transporter ATP-binding protein [Croceibacterium sp. TMG7-5b_MA50]|uniref:ABC transporter ATP-binding protein n=1 Tax=Croceibacterium sp. TMG7-5b_MA50 TaxID=3121290 RepID=UPI003221E082